MSRYTPPENGSDAPAVCPLLKRCQQRMMDLEEYERLKKKWTEHARKQDAEEVNTGRKLTKKGFKKGADKSTVDWVQEVSGTQVFYLEFTPKQNASPEEVKALTDAKQERFNRMCPHFKKEQLGLATGEPPYLECQIFSEWYYSQKRD